MGYDYGFMLSQEISQVYHLLLDSLLPLPIEQDVIVPLIEIEMDYQVCLFVKFSIDEIDCIKWTSWLSAQVPEQYMQEIQGIMVGNTGSLAA